MSLLGEGGCCDCSLSLVGYLALWLKAEKMKLKIIKQKSPQVRAVASMFYLSYLLLLLWCSDGGCARAVVKVFAEVGGSPGLHFRCFSFWAKGLISLGWKSFLLSKETRPWLLSNGPQINTDSLYLFLSTNSPFNRHLMVSSAWTNRVVFIRWKKDVKTLLSAVGKPI